MGRPIDQRTVRAYADSFKKFPCLKTRGFSVLMNVSGRLFKSSKPSLKDVDANTEVGF